MYVFCFEEILTSVIKPSCFCFGTLPVDSSPKIFHQNISHCPFDSGSVHSFTTGTTFYKWWILQLCTSKYSKDGGELQIFSLCPQIKMDHAIWPVKLRRVVFSNDAFRFQIETSVNHIQEIIVYRSLSQHSWPHAGFVAHIPWSDLLNFYCITPSDAVNNYMGIGYC